MPRTRRNVEDSTSTILHRLQSLSATTTASALSALACVVALGWAVDSVSTLIEQNRALVAALAGRMTPAAIAAELRIPIHRIEGYLDDVVAVHDAVHWSDKPIVTAGGSAYFDLVAEKLAPLVGAATVILRSGAYQLHDDGFYRGITPLPGLRSAIHGWSRVISRPEPGLAILDGGKRDFPYDEGMPVSEHGAIEKLNDQHAYLRSAVGRDGGPALGEVLRLGLSHPCTAFDKWRVIPVVDDADGADPIVVGLVSTYF